MYTLNDYLSMMQDSVRISAYQAAIKAQVRPGDLVLDLGAGTGIMTFLALEAGAHRVIAIDENPALRMIEQVACENGYRDRITCLQGDSLKIHLPEKVDVMIYDIRGILPLCGNNLRVLQDATQRFLKPGGRLIPQRDTLFAAPIENAKTYAQIQGWRNGFGKTDFSLVSAWAANQITGTSIEPRHLLAPGAALAHLDYQDLRSFSLHMKNRYSVTRPGTCHGLGAWFESELCPGVRMSIAPGKSQTVYGHAFFPLEAGHPVELGDWVEVEIEARFTGQDYVLLWSLGVESQGRMKFQEKHSTFAGALWTWADYQKRSDNFIPELNEEGKIDLWILKRMAEKESLSDIARQILERFPSSFANWYEALTRVSDLSQKYSEYEEIHS